MPGYPLLRHGETVTNLALRVRESGMDGFMVAAKCGFSPSTLTRYVKGRPVKPEHLMALCEVLRCNPQDLEGTTVVGI